MNKSDFEINKAVAEELKLNYEIDYSMRIVVIGEHIIYNPCLNPGQAMPIVIANGISSLFNNDEWICSVPYTEFLSINESLYRAAMEVFLMMKDSEK